MVGPFGVGVGAGVDLSRRDGGASSIPAAVGTPRRLPVAVLDLTVVRAGRRLGDLPQFGQVEVSHQNHPNSPHLFRLHKTNHRNT